MNMFEHMLRTLLLLGLIVAVLGCGETSDDLIVGYKISSVEEDHKWTEITKCVMAVKVDYTTGKIVRNSAVAELVFRKFVIENDAFVKSFQVGVSDCEFEYCSPGGMLNGVKYWRVYMSCLDLDPGTRITFYSWHVSENGDVVRLLDCI